MIKTCCFLDGFNYDTAVMDSINFQKLDGSITYCYDIALESMLHIHREIELIYVIEGESYAYANQKEYLLKKGDVFISFPYQVHNYKTIVDGKFLIIIFPPEVLFSMNRVFFDNTPQTNRISSEYITTLFERLVTENKSFFHHNIVCGYLNLIIPHMLKHIGLLPFSDIKNSSIDSILHYCANHYREKLSLEVVAENIHVNKYYISKTVNSTLNLSFTEFVNSLRIIKACDLLKNTDKSITYIAGEVGFGTLRTFNRAFKTMMGETPRDYRKKT